MNRCLIRARLIADAFAACADRQSTASSIMRRTSAVCLNAGKETAR